MREHERIFAAALEFDAARREAVRAGLGGAQPSLEQVARRMGLSARTLRRRLAEANTSLLHTLRSKRDVGRFLAAV